MTDSFHNTHTGPVMLAPDKDLIHWPRPLAFFWACFGYWCWFVDPVNQLRCKYFGAAFMCLGFGILIGLHLFMYFMISRMCNEMITTGDMGDIKKHWQKPHFSEFFIAVTPQGEVLGSVAVRKGGLENDSNKTKGDRLDEPFACCVYKVTTKASMRGQGIARTLMKAAEDWAVAEGSTEMQLVTASIGAKNFYKNMGYMNWYGEPDGATISKWLKVLRKTRCTCCPYYTPMWCDDLSLCYGFMNSCYLAPCKYCCPTPMYNEDYVRTH